MNNTIYFFIILLLFMNYYNNITLRIIFGIIILIIFYLFIYKNQLIISEKLTDFTKKSINKVETDPLFDILKQFKKYNEISYNEGLKYYKLYLYDFDKTLNTVYNRNYLNNSKIYLKKSMDCFREIGLNIPAKNYFNNYENNNVNVTENIDLLNKTISEIYNLQLSKLNELYKINNDKNEVNIYSNFLYKNDLSNDINQFTNINYVS